MNTIHRTSHSLTLDVWWIQPVFLPIGITMEESQQLTNQDENIFSCGFDEIKSRKYISLENPWAVKLDKSLLILWVL